MRFRTAAWIVLNALLLAGCGGPKTQIIADDDASLQNYRRVGIPAFIDKTGHGQEIADAFDARFQQALYENVDQKGLAQLLSQYKPDRDLGFGVEAVEAIRTKTGINALLLGRMTPDWSAAVITFVEMNTGDTIMRAVVRPRGRKKKSFATPAEIADEFMRAFLKH